MSEVAKSPPKHESSTARIKAQSSQMHQSRSNVSISSILNPWKNRAASTDITGPENSAVTDVSTVRQDKSNHEASFNDKELHDHDTKNTDISMAPEPEYTLEEYREDLRRQHSQSEVTQDISTLNHPQERKSSAWFFWRAEDASVVPNEAQLQDDISPFTSSAEPVIASQDNAEHRETNDNISTIDRTVEQSTWVDWINPVSKIGSVVSIIYNPDTQHNKSIQEITPNQISEVFNSASQVESATASLHKTPSHRSSNFIESANKPWWDWHTWGIGGNDQSANSLPIEGSVKFSRDTVNAVKDQRANGIKTSSWAFFSSSRLRQDDPEVVKGELAVDGTESEYSPALTESMPQSQFEISENLIKPVFPKQQQKQSLNNTQSDEEQEEFNSFVLPNVDINYRNETLKTNTRILMANVFPIFFQNQRHLYHKRKYTDYKGDIEERSNHISAQTSSTSQEVHTKSSKWPKKKAVVIGIHGFLPLKMVRSLIGQSTGSASTITDNAKRSLMKWCSANKIDVDIETIALEGEGKIFERVSQLFKLLENWMSSIYECDYLIVASHSQSVPVCIHILSKLITLGYVDKVSKIGMINMAGICLGPISGLDSKLSVKQYSKLENDIMLEMFDFQDPESLQSQELVRSLRILVKRNVKLTFVGSFDDQFIPLFSSLCCQVNHPNIFRALYTSGEVSQSLFLGKLVSYILFLINLGYEHDKFLIELSRFLYGNVGTGGHCKILEDDKVYFLGISNVLETSNMLQIAPMKVKKINSKSLSSNQYHLPWCLRGFLEEFSKLPNIDSKSLISKLINDFQQWNPESKLHKEVKYCIEVMGEFQLDDLCC